MNGKPRRHAWYCYEAGAAMTEYAISFLIVLPLLIGATLLFSLSGGDDEDQPSGAIVTRGEASLVPARHMSPAKQDLCKEGGSEPFVSPELCF